jgi:hypothetical protein
MIPGPPGAVVTREEFEADPSRWRGCQARRRRAPCRAPIPAHSALGVARGLARPSLRARPPNIALPRRSQPTRAPARAAAGGGQLHGRPAVRQVRAAAAGGRRRRGRPRLGRQPARRHPRLGAAPGGRCLRGPRADERPSLACVATFGRVSFHRPDCRLRRLHSNDWPPPLPQKTHAGLPLVDPETGGATRRVHVYAPRWALQADGYDPVVFPRPLLRWAGGTCTARLCVCVCVRA